METTTERSDGVCPVCASPLSGVDEVACARCETRHHRSCFLAARRCATYACASRSHVELPDRRRHGRESLSLRDGEPPDESLPSFVRQDVVLSLMLGILPGALSTLAILVLGFVAGMKSGLLPRWLVDGSVLPFGFPLFLLLSTIAAAIASALSVRQILRFDRARGELVAELRAFGRRVGSLSLTKLSDLSGLLVHRDPLGESIAYASLLPPSAEASGLRRLLLPFFLERGIGGGHVKLGKLPTDPEARRDWIVRLETVAEQLDLPLRLPPTPDVVSLLGPRPPTRKLPASAEAKADSSES